MKAILLSIALVLITTSAFSVGLPEGGSGSSGGGGTQLVTMLVTFYIILHVPSVLLGLIPAYIANRKGRKFARWWIYGWLLFIIALVHSLSIKGRRCPYCAEQIRPEAKVCRFCGRDLAPIQDVSQKQAPTQ
jgi:hypothetical protein